MKHLLLAILVCMSTTVPAQVWEQTRGPVEDDVSDLCIAPNGWLFAMTPFGINRSTDGGETWTRPFRFDTPSDSSRIMVAPNGNIIFSADIGIFVTTDLGETVTLTWTAMNPPVRQFATSGSGRIFACAPSGTFFSDDNGLTWSYSYRGVAELDWHAYGIAASGDSVVVLHDQFYISADNGESWKKYPLGVPLPTRRITICPDGSWLIFTNRSIHRKPANSSLSQGWVDLSGDFFRYAETFIAYDRMEDESIFVSSLSSGLWRVQEDTLWTSVNKGLETDSIRGTAHVTRVVHDAVNDVYYAATIGRGVCRSLPMSAVKKTAETIEIHVFPNPAAATATVRCSLDEPSLVSITVVDNIGRTRIRKTAYLNEGIHEIPIVLDEMSAGSYFLHVHTGPSHTTKAIAIIK